MKYFPFKVLLALLTALVFTGSAFAQIPDGYEKGFSTISKEEILKNLTFLASDSLKGRAAGSKENLISAMYVADHFQKYGLKPLLTSIIKAAPVKKEEEFVNPVEETELNTDDASQYALYFQKFNIKKSRISSTSLVLNNGKMSGSTVISLNTI